MQTRTESDSMGRIEVPEGSYYGAQTARSLHYFNIGKERMPLEVVYALAVVKIAAARSNLELELLNTEKCDLICKAAQEILDGKWDLEFPLCVWQTGSGTQTNMNVNEVIANRANEIALQPKGTKSPVHPNDDVNRGQSSNDVFPAAMHIAAVQAVQQHFLPNLENLISQCEVKQKEFADVVKMGRTHMMDATPITVGQEISAWVAQLRSGQARVETALVSCLSLPIGGTAVGTGLNSHPKFAALCVREVQALTHIQFHVAQNKFSEMAAHDALVTLSSSLKNVALTLFKIANDIRLAASGPRAGIGEFYLPQNEPGSSIMPGKVNPTQVEALCMVCLQVVGNDAAVSWGGATGQFQLNVSKPLIIKNVLNSTHLLADGIKSFSEFCLAGLELNRKQIQHHLQNSLMLVTALTPLLGYDKCALIAHEAYEKNISLKEAALSLNLLSAEEFDTATDPLKMV